VSEHRIPLRQYDHPDILVRVDDVLDTQVGWLLGYFSSQVQSGLRFAAGQTVQSGWVILKMAADPDGALLVTEPDFKSMPIEWAGQANRCVRFLSIQRAVCEQIGAEPDFPSLAQPCAAPEQLPSRSQFALVREQFNGSHSGWLLQRHIGDPARLRLVSLYEAALSNPSLIPFFALPSGAAVEREGARVVVSYEGRAISTDNCELLARLHEHGWFGDDGAA